jgi:hypothetical protein
MESLMALEDQQKASRAGVPLTNEIAVFVSATEVSHSFLMSLSLIP